MNIGFALCGSFCTFDLVLTQLEVLKQRFPSIIPILFGYNTVYAERGMFDNLTPARDNIFFYNLGKTMDGTQLETIYN